MINSSTAMHGALKTETSDGRLSPLRPWKSEISQDLSQFIFTQMQTARFDSQLALPSEMALINFLLNPINCAGFQSHYGEYSEILLTCCRIS